MIIDGKKIAEELNTRLKEKIDKIQGRKPGLTFILVGENAASLTYVRMKKQMSKNLGIVSNIIALPQAITQKELFDTINIVNEDPLVDSILVQLPLPPHINEIETISHLLPEKDVDGFHPYNFGKMLLGDFSGFLPCTPHGIKMLLEKSHIEVEGKHVVIIGRSNIVGKPLAAILMQKQPGCNATVTVAHSRTKNLTELTKTADILVAAMGHPLFIKKEMVKPGATVIDVGMNKLHGKIVGDVDFDQVSKVAAHITPVPKGVGPMTIAMLMQNTYKCFLQRKKKEF